MHAPGLANHQQAAQVDLAFKRTFNPHTAAAAVTFPDNPGSQHGGDPLGGGLGRGAGGVVWFLFRNIFILLWVLGCQGYCNPNRHTAPGLSFAARSEHRKTAAPPTSSMVTF